MLKLLLRISAIALFIIFFGFAIKNTQETTLHFFLNYELHGPLILVLLGFFAVGAILGVLAMTSTVFHHRRDLSKHQKTIAKMHQDNLAERSARVNQPQTDNVLIK